MSNEPTIRIKREADHIKIEAEVQGEYRQFRFDPEVVTPREAILHTLKQVRDEFGSEMPNDVRLPREDWSDFFPKASRRD